MDKTVRIGVDSSELKNAQSSLRNDTEQLARDMIRSSRQYSTSSKEVLKDIDDQIRAIEKRNKLDEEFRKLRLDSLRDQGGMSAAQYSNQKSEIGKDSRSDELQTRLLRELIDEVKKSSKDEIREDRRNVESLVGGSGVGRLGVSGDEFTALKRTIQQDIISEASRNEGIQSGGFNMRGLIGAGSRYGSMAAQGNFQGLMMGAGGEAIGGMTGRGIMAGAGGMSGGAIAATGIGAIIIGAVVAAFAGEKKLLKDGRDYAITTQTAGITGMVSARDRFASGGVYQGMGMSTIEGMNFYASLAKSAGGDVGENIPMLAGITRSRNVSPELLNQTLGFQRYSNEGSAGGVVSSLELALKRIYPYDETFRRKLVQLPEFMGVYNSLAQQMLQTTGRVNSVALSGFVGGIAEGFGVEGVNLQRYAGNLMGGMKGSSNNFVRKMQFASMRQAYGNLSYQEMLEKLEDPTSNKEYMRVMYSNMQNQGLSVFRGWTQGMGFGAKESGNMFRSKEEFEKSLDNMGSGGNKTLPSQDKIMNNYYSEATKFYSKQEVVEEKMIEFFQNMLSKWAGFTLGGSLKDNIVEAADQVAIKVAQNGGKIFPY